jgi:tetratricopeptide (TPR) repeat protein
MTRLPLFLVAVSLALAPTAQAAGSMQVFTNHSLIKACSDHARQASEGRMAPHFAVATCTAAIETEAASSYDRAVAHNNRGVVQLAMMGEWQDARADFDAAATLRPEIGESYVNRGSVLLAEDRPAEAIAEIERGMRLGLKEPWKAHFNRALARERMNDARGAYEDLRRATELKPGWEPAETQLTRFSVRRAGAQP